MTTVKIVDSTHKYFGQELPGGCVYYDVYHQGSGGPDLFQIETPEGKQTILSNKIDEQHYWEQRRQLEIAKLGADVGDTVRIIRSGSGSSKANFDWKASHVITKIDSSGYVEWDNGDARGFRPDMEVISQASTNEV
ncbi:hypothetical protein DFQ01_11082 [Paenibacillus cellulosilyticus]|uniref:Uncharacterized protein n=1 Tax=Paenibacillus cellulosilyticus TaxID=375489 RepID=A0A2V2YSJ2_9BACL|nr:hypothetical protein [Paenibacillus cellulosilyticus]PWW01192.1 hypothetical protein DFQ01_11082 [Paenibacillus cellulosilyticus]QKS46852.1 hypothetical protein HUB94_20425 [Paenibacillus cellulosilyticus]